MVYHPRLSKTCVPKNFSLKIFETNQLSIEIGLFWPVQINLSVNDPSQDVVQAVVVDDKVELAIWLGETKMMFWMIARL